MSTRECQVCGRIYFTGAAFYLTHAEANPGACYKCERCNKERNGFYDRHPMSDEKKISHSKTCNEKNAHW